MFRQRSLGFFAVDPDFGFLRSSRIFGGRRNARFGARRELFGERRGVTLEHLSHDVDALRLQVGLFRRARDVDLHRHRHFGVKRDLDLVHADRLDRAIEHDLALRHVSPFSLQRVDDVARADRTVKLAGVRSLADQLDSLAVDALRSRFGVAAAIGIVFLDLRAVGFEDLAVRFVGAERLLARQQVVAGEAVLDLHHVADSAELLDAFKQDHFYVEFSLLHDVGKKADVPGALDCARELTLLLGGYGGDARRHDLAAFGHEALEEADVLVIDARRVLAREGAGLAAAEECAGHYWTSCSRAR